MTDFFPKAAALTYDAKNRGLAPISTAMHFLVGLLLKDLPDHPRVLCVGIGTGAELLSLAEDHPGWTFVGVDPSAAMLEVCRERLQAAGVADRTELVHGYVSDVSDEAAFDVVLAILVGHFVPRAERRDFYTSIYKRLKPDGRFIDTELSSDLEAAEFSLMLEGWEQVQTLMGATPESLQQLPKLLREQLTVLPPAEVADIMQAAGFAQPLRFFQALMIQGWYVRK